MTQQQPNQAYIYYNALSGHFKSDKIRTTTHYWTATPETQITGIHLNVSHASKVSIYQGEDADEKPITMIASKEIGAANVFIAFDATTFGDSAADKLVIALKQGGSPTPTINEIAFYSVMVALYDGFLDYIVPMREERGGGVIELADGSLVQYRGYGRNRWRWKLGAKFVDKQMLARLDALYAERPEFFFAQDPDRYPDRVYRCILENPIFRIPYTTQWKGNGYSIEMEIAEI